ncbi:MAG: glycosyltransferase family 9 protein [Candidatus Melainabacteria bacterium]
MLKKMLRFLQQALLWLPCWLVTRFQSSPNRQFRRIGLLNMGGLGDYMMFYPVARAVRLIYPQAELVMISAPNYAAVADLFPEIDEMLLLSKAECALGNLVQQLRLLELDALIVNHDFQIPLMTLSLALVASGIPFRLGCQRNPLRSACLTITQPSHPPAAQHDYMLSIFYTLAQTFARATGRPIPADPLPLFSRTISDDRAPQNKTLPADLPAPGGNPRILIHPGTSKSSKDEHWTKSWPPSCWAALCGQLCETHPGATIMLTGGPDDTAEIAAIEQHLRQLPETIQARIHNINGQFPATTQLRDLLAASDLFIGCDSFAMHLALHVNTPTVAIFALTDERRFLPPSPENVAVATVSDLPCRPCVPHQRSTACEHPVCLNVPVETVASKANALLRAV